MVCSLRPTPSWSGLLLVSLRGGGELKIYVKGQFADLSTSSSHRAWPWASAVSLRHNVLGLYWPHLSHPSFPNWSWISTYSLQIYKPCMLWYTELISLACLNKKLNKHDLRILLLVQRSWERVNPHLKSYAKEKPHSSSLEDLIGSKNFHRLTQNFPRLLKVL